MDVIEELDEVGGGLDISTVNNDTNDFSASFAVLVFPNKISRIHFPIITNDFSIAANTINMSPDQAAQLARINASWAHGKPITSEILASDNTKLPFLGQFRSV